MTKKIIPTNTSDLVNDIGFITNNVENLTVTGKLDATVERTKNDEFGNNIFEKYAKKEDMETHVTKADVDENGNLTLEKTEAVSDISIDDYGYLIVTV